MSELAVHEQHPGTSIARELMPDRLPEAGFQSYEKLKNNALSQRPDFLAGRTINPELSYPELEDTSDMDRGIKRLDETIVRVYDMEPDTEVADIIATTLEFRISEMEYVKLLADLNTAVEGRASEESVFDLSRQANELVEKLYGAPDPELTNSTIAELWKQLDDKQMSIPAGLLHQQLSEGFSWGGGSRPSWGDFYVPPLPRPVGAEKLPSLNHPSLNWVGEIILESLADIDASLTRFWNQKVARHGIGYKAGPEDIKEAFEMSLDILDPERTSGISIILDPDATALSWDTPSMAVKIGGKRLPIGSKKELFQKISHELIVHGGRAIEGLKTRLPVLGTGLYTATTRPDFLTFEEGFAANIEKAIDKVYANTEENLTWGGPRLGFYINLSLANAGADFRTTFETSWRYQLLNKLDDNQDVTAEAMRAAQIEAYRDNVRIFRGTPTDIHERYPGIQPLTFNKDLAYISGLVIAMKHIQKLYRTRDEAGLLRLFKGRYDPTIPEQAAIADKYIV